jgi:hypothetical protein
MRVKYTQNTYIISHDAYTQMKTILCLCAE